MYTSAQGPFQDKNDTTPEVETSVPVSRLDSPSWCVDMIAKYLTGLFVVKELIKLLTGLAFWAMTRNQHSFYSFQIQHSS